MTHISAKKKSPFDLVFPCGDREKRLNSVVWVTSAEFYGFGKRVERKQKGGLRLPLPPGTSEPLSEQSADDTHAHTHTHRYGTPEQTLSIYRGGH